MTDLIARLEAATENERALFEEAFASCFHEPQPGCEPAWRPENPKQPIYHAWKTQQITFRKFIDADAYLDAALALVPEGWRLQLSDWDAQSLRDRGPWQAVITPPGKRDDFSEWHPRCDHAPTPALALCIAALKARNAS